MSKRTYNFDKSWAIAVVAIAAFFGPQVMPDQLTAQSSGRLVVWPVFGLSGSMIALWAWIWIASLKSRSIPAPLALLSFFMTAYPLYVVAQSWGA